MNFWPFVCLCKVGLHVGQLSQVGRYLDGHGTPRGDDFTGITSW